MRFNLSNIFLNSRTYSFTEFNNEIKYNLVLNTSTTDINHITINTYKIIDWFVPQAIIDSYMLYKVTDETYNKIEINGNIDSCDYIANIDRSNKKVRIRL